MDLCYKQQIGGCDEVDICEPPYDGKQYTRHCDIQVAALQEKVSDWSNKFIIIYSYLIQNILRIVDICN